MHGPLFGVQEQIGRCVKPGPGDWLKSFCAEEFKMIKTHHRLCVKDIWPRTSLAA